MSSMRVSTAHGDSDAEVTVRMTLIEVGESVLIVDKRRKSVSFRRKQNSLLEIDQV
jgi:hypothetical protein